MKYLFLILLAVSVTCYAQPETLDKLELKNNKVISGNVVKITSSTIQFKEAVTNLLYEYQKSEIKDLRLSNGTVLSFNESPSQAGDVTGAMPGNNQTTPGQSTTTSPAQPSQGSSGNNTSNTTGNSTGNNTSNNTSASNPSNAATNTNTASADTTRRTQQLNNNAQQQTTNDSNGLSMPAMIILGASGLIVLLLLGKAIF